MQVTVEQLEPCKVAVNVEVGPEEVSRTVDRVFADISRRVAVPGFRKGRAPRNVVERYLDPAVVQEQTVSALVTEFYPKAIEEKGIEPFAQAELDVQELETGQPFRFTATIATRPEIRLGEYKGLSATRRKVEVTDKDVDADLELLRRRATRFEDTDAEVAGANMVALVDMDVFRGDRHLKNRSREGVGVDMDDTQSVPAFNLTIEGMRIGEMREMPVHFPEDYRDPVLAGKDVTFKITLKGLKAKVVPEVDDELAKSAGMESLEELRAKVRERLEGHAQEAANREVRDQVVEAAVAAAEVHFPDVLVQESVTDTMRDQARELEGHGLTIDDYLRERGIDFATYERELREDARVRIRTQLVLEKIAEEEKLQVTPEDVDAELAQIAQSANIPVETMRAVLEGGKGDTLRNLRVQILFRKAIDLLQESANITEQ